MIQTSTTNVDLELFRGAMGFAPVFTCKFGNTKKAPVAKIQTKPAEAEERGDHRLAAAQDQKAKTRIKLSKQLIVSDAYDEIKTFYGEIGRWTDRRTVPSFWRTGFKLASRDAVAEIETRYTQAAETELPILVEAFVAEYPGKVLEARGILEPVGLWTPNDYPAADELPAMFGISWNWISFTVPEGLPASLRQKETEKLERTMTDAADEIRNALRLSFNELITHAMERLTAAPGEKLKGFHESTIGNIHEFLETFNNRNLMNDQELANLVAQARGMLQGVTAKRLKDLPNVRENTRQQFEAIKNQLDGMITVKASRRFQFDAEAGPGTETPPAEPAPEAAPELNLAAA